MAATATSNPHSGRRKKAAASSNKNKDKWTNTEQTQFKKGIKPCNKKTKTVTTGSGEWTNTEQTQFKQGIIKHGWGNWKVLLEENIITTRDRSQIKSRAQKLKKNHPDVVANLIREHEKLSATKAPALVADLIRQHKNGGATKSVVNKVSEPTSTKKSTKPSTTTTTTTTTAPTTKKKKAPQRRRGSTSSVKCKSPVSSQAASVSTITTTTTNKMRRRGSCPGNLGMEGRVVCKLQPGGGAIAKRRGSLRKFICNLCGFSVV